MIRATVRNGGKGAKLLRNDRSYGHDHQTRISLAKGWIQAVILVFLFGFFVLGFLAYRTYTGEPPIPAKVADPNGRVLLPAIRGIVPPASTILVSNRTWSDMFIFAEPLKSPVKPSLKLTGMPERHFDPRASSGPAQERRGCSSLWFRFQHPRSLARPGFETRRQSKNCAADHVLSF